MMELVVWRSLFATLLVGCSFGPHDLQIHRVEPGMATSIDVVPIQIEGSGFHLPIRSDLDDGHTTVGDVTVMLGDLPLEGAAWHGQQRIAAAVPAGLPVGRYDVTVMLGDRTGVLADGYEVVDDGGTLTGCVPRWMDGPTLGTAQPIAGVNTASGENDAFVTRDELELYVTRDGDVWRASRSSPTETFGAAVLDPVSSSAADTKISITSDGLTAYLNTSRTPTEGGSDVWRGRRPSTTEPFTFDLADVAAVNDDGQQWDPHISGDGLRLYLAPEAPTTEQHIAVATRATVDDPFGAPETIAELAAARDNDPTLTLDERVIVFATNRDGTRRLWYAVRPSRAEPFGPPAPLPGAMTGDDGAHLSGDGCWLYFSSARAGTPDIYVAPIE